MRYEIIKEKQLNDDIKARLIFDGDFEGYIIDTQTYCSERLMGIDGLALDLDGAIEYFERFDISIFFKKCEESYSL